MDQFAIFDTGGGFLQWLGPATDAPGAVKALHLAVGDWLAGDEAPSDECLDVYAVSDAEAKALDAWATTSNESARPALAGQCTSYSVGQVLPLIEG